MAFFEAGRDAGIDCINQGIAVLAFHRYVTTLFDKHHSKTRILA